MIKAEIKERYISSGRAQKAHLEEITHETRYFSSLAKFQEWYATFKGNLWRDDEEKVNLAEGIFVVTYEIELDNVAPPIKLETFATFSPGVSYYYGKQASA